MDYEIHPKLDNIIKKLSQKDKTLATILIHKIEEIKNSKYIEHYKNLRRPLQKYKRVHITEKFVLIFEIKPNINLVIFRYFDHRNKIYTKKYD
jgi:YafQ family addiction module toxin component